MRRAIVLGLMLFLVGGCQLWPWGKKNADIVPGVTPPSERIKTLRALTSEASGKGGQEQEALAAKLLARYPKEHDPLIREEIVGSIGMLSCPSAMGVLQQGLKDSDADVRVSACRMLGKHKNPESSRLLAEALTADVDLDVRLAAADSLAYVGDAGAIKSLGTALDDRDPAMQFRAVTALRKIAPEDMGNDVDRWRAYVKGEPIPPSRAPSLAEQVKGWFR